MQGEEQSCWIYKDSDSQHERGFFIHNYEQNQGTNGRLLSLGNSSEQPIRKDLPPQGQNWQDLRQDNHSEVCLVEKDQLNKNSNSQRNICCNICKRIMKEMFKKQSTSIIRYLCGKSGCQQKYFLNYYKRYKGQSIGIEKLVELIVPNTNRDIGYKKALLLFIKWFLRKKYMLYLLTLCKTTQKDTYIDFKNRFLLYLEADIFNPIGIQLKIE